MGWLRCSSCQLPTANRRLVCDTTSPVQTTARRWAYADSKAMDELLALAYHSERGLDCVIVRLFNTVGPRQSGQYGMVIPRFVEQALANGPLEVHGDGTQTRCFCHVSDTIRALKGLMDADSISGGATGCTRRNGGTRPPRERTSIARHASSSKVSSGGGPSSTVTTQSPHANPLTTQVSQSILVVMARTLTGSTDSGPRGSPVSRVRAGPPGPPPRRPWHRRRGCRARPPGRR